MKIKIRKTGLLSSPAVTDCTGYLSLIQYCPDLARREAVNVGVFLYCPEQNFIGTKMEPSNDRIRRFFGDAVETDFYLDQYKQNVAQRLERDRAGFRTLEHVNYFIGNLANDIQMTEPRAVLVKDPAQTLEELFNELVAEPSTRQSKHS